MSYNSLNAPFPSTVFSKQNKAIEKKNNNGTLEKFQLFQGFAPCSGNILGFLRMKSNVGIRPPISAHEYPNLILLFSSKWTILAIGLATKVRIFSGFLEHYGIFRIL